MVLDPQLIRIVADANASAVGQGREVRVDVEGAMADQ